MNMFSNPKSRKSKSKGFTKHVDCFVRHDPKPKESSIVGLPEGMDRCPL
jgi:hypothetical protein